VRHWFKARWEAFQNSYDAPEAAVQSGPGTLVAVANLAIGLAVVGYVPYVSAWSQMRMPYLPIATAVLGGITSHIAWRHKATGTIGTACMLIDTVLYTTTFALAALLTTGGFSVTFGIFLALFMLTFPASVYSINLLLAAALVGPPLVLLAVFGGPPSIWAIFWASSALALTTSYRTGQRRALAAQNENLRTALVEANLAVDKSLDNAITASLLNVGHFLHELRNLQALQKMNLEYISEEAQLDDNCKAALLDVISAREAEERLIARALADIRSKAQPVSGSLDLEAAVREALEDPANPLGTSVAFDAPPFQVNGNREHLKTVLQNIRRNAAQAGASRLELRVRAEPGARVAHLELTDNGPGIPADLVDTLFRPFSTGKSNGTGLGMYLARRYVELMGGHIEAGNAPQGGARFSITLPGRATDEASPSPAPVAERATAEPPRVQAD
jgi:signal transduction histidine kinase